MRNILELIKPDTYGRFRGITLIIALLVADVAFFSTTNPNHSNAALLIVGFVLLAASLYTLFNGLGQVLRVYGLQAHAHRLALILSLIISFLVALQSVGELTLRDTLVVVPLTVIAYAYLSYGSHKRKRG